MILLIKMYLLHHTWWY